MKILAISYLFPNSIYPNYGIFVLNRLKAVQKYCEVKVINPIPWFPFHSYFARYRNYHLIPERETIQGIETFHPRFFIIPRLFKTIDALSYYLAVFPIARRLQSSYPCDLVDLHWTYPDLMAGHLTAKFLKKKIMVTIRGKEAFYLDEFGFRKKIVASYLLKADRVVALGQELKQMCEISGIARDRVQVIRNGIDTSLFHYKTQDMCRKKIGLPDHQRIILTIGSLIYRKGFDRLIKILPQVLPDFPESHLYIIGDKGPEGDCRHELIELIQKLQLNNQVHFVGEVPHPDLVLWYNAADIFSLPSRGEGSPNVLSEALACGCPSVATNVGAVSDILSEPFLGTMAPNTDEGLLTALLKTLSLDYDRPRIASYMESYDWDWCARQVLDAYHLVLKE